MAAIPPSVNRIHLTQALADDGITPLSPAKLIPSDRLAELVRVWDLAALKGALVGTHREPDEDAIFSVLTVVRELMGHLPGGPHDPVQMTFGGGHVSQRLHRWLENVYVDPSSAGPARPVTIALDAAVPGQLKGLWGNLSSTPVLVLDHHDMEPARETLGVHPDVDFALWNDPNADAACVMAAALAIHVGERDGRALSVESAEWSLRGVLWDTRDFQNPGTRLETLQVAKYLAQRLPQERLQAVLSDVAASMPSDTHSPAASHGLHLEIIEAAGGRALILGCDAPRVRAAQNASRLPFEEVHRLSMEELDHRWANENGRALWVLIRQIESDAFSVSFRSRTADDLALRLARLLEPNGGGHTNRARALMTGQSYDRVKAAVFQLLESQVQGPGTT